MEINELLSKELAQVWKIVDTKNDAYLKLTDKIRAYALINNKPELIDILAENLEEFYK